MYYNGLSIAGNEESWALYFLQECKFLRGMIFADFILNFVIAWLSAFLRMALE